MQIISGQIRKTDDYFINLKEGFKGWGEPPPLKRETTAVTNEFMNL